MPRGPRGHRRGSRPMRPGVRTLTSAAPWNQPTSPATLGRVPTLAEHTFRAEVEGDRLGVVRWRHRGGPWVYPSGGRTAQEVARG